MLVMVIFKSKYDEVENQNFTYKESGQFVITIKLKRECIHLITSGKVIFFIPYKSNVINLVPFYLFLLEKYIAQKTIHKQNCEFLNYFNQYG